MTMKDFECPNCDSRLWVRVFGTWTTGEHPNQEVITSEGYDKDKNSYTTNVGQKCIVCGKVQILDEIPDSHEQQHGIPQDAIDRRSEKTK